MALEKQKINVPETRVSCTENILVLQMHSTNYLTGNHSENNVSVDPKYQEILQEKVSFYGTE